MYKFSPQSVKNLYMSDHPMDLLKQGGSTLHNQYRPNGDPDPVIRLITKRKE